MVLPVLAALLLLGAATTPAPGPPACGVALSAEEQAAVVAYGRLLRLYRARHEAEAIAELAGWPPKDVGRATAALVVLGEEPECLGPNGLSARDVEAAALLETDRALDERAAASNATERDLGLKRAERLLEVATRGAGPDRRCRWMRAVALYYHGADALEAAGQWYQRSLSTCPGDADTLLGLGLVHERRGTRHLRDLSELTTAEAYYRRALEIAPTWMELRLRLARTRQLLGKTSEAVDQLQDILAQPSVEPGNAYLAQLMLGQIQEAAGRLQVAESCYRAALAAEPRAQVATIALSHALYRAKQRSEAGQLLDRWLENADGPPPADVDDWLLFQWGSPARVARPHERLLAPLRQELAR